MEREVAGDKNLTCRDCKREFPFTAGEQEFFASRGFGQPSRCPDCRKANKARRETGLETTGSRTPAGDAAPALPVERGSRGYEPPVRAASGWDDTPRPAEVELKEIPGAEEDEWGRGRGKKPRSRDHSRGDKRADDLYD